MNNPNEPKFLNMYELILQDIENDDKLDAQAKFLSYFANERYQFKIDYRYTGMSNKTLLMIAAEYSHFDLVRELISRKAKINAFGYGKLTALHYAAQGGHNFIVAYLLHHAADQEAKTITGYTAFHLAALGNHIGVVNVLIDFGANINAVTAEGLTPLHLAAREGHTRIVRRLLEIRKLNITGEIADEKKYHKTPLELASINKHDDIVKLLTDAEIKGWGFPLPPEVPMRGSVPPVIAPVNQLPITGINPTNIPGSINYQNSVNAPARSHLHRNRFSRWAYKQPKKRQSADIRNYFIKPNNSGDDPDVQIIPAPNSVASKPAAFLSSQDNSGIIHSTINNPPANKPDANKPSEKKRRKDTEDSDDEREENSLIPWYP